MAIERAFVITLPTELTGLLEEVAWFADQPVEQTVRTFALMGLHLWTQDHGYRDEAEVCMRTIVAEAKPEHLSITVVNVDEL